MRRASLVAWLATVISVSSWAFGRVPDYMAADYGAARSHLRAAQDERQADYVQFVTDLCGARPAQPGQRPDFIPAGAVVFKAGRANLVSLETALSGTAGSVVAWVP